MQRRLRQTRWSSLLYLLVILVLSGTLHAQRASEECTGNESWLPIDNPTPGYILSAGEAGGSLYFYATTGQTDGILYSWDGSTLASVDTMTGVNYGVNTMQEYNGALYVGGWFSSIDGVAGTSGVARWNGSSWESVGVTGYGISAMGVYNNDLYVAGLLIDQNGDTLHGLAKYDGTNWTEVANVFVYGDSVGNINSMAVYDGKLIVSGYFVDVNDVAMSNYAQYDGTNWSSIPALDGQNGAQQMVVWNGKLYGANYGVFEWDGGSTATNIAGTDTVPCNQGITVHDNKLYVSGSVYLQSGDSGRLGLMRNFSSYDGTAWTPISSVNGYGRLVDYNGTLITFGQFTSSCGTALNNIAFLCDQNNCSHITGTVYHDADNDGAYDNGEVGLFGHIVEINPGGFYASTDSNGVYSQFVLPGNYSVATADHRYWNTTSTSPLSVSIASAGSTSSGNDFESAPIPDIYDLRVSLAGGGRMRPGFTTAYTLYYANVGTEATSATLSFTYDDGNLTFDNSTTTPDRNSNGTLEWDLSNIQPGEGGSMTVYFTVSSNTQLGTVVCAYTDLGMGESHTDTASLDNHDSSCTTVRGSYDPNDIAVTPAGDFEGVIRPNDTVLAYQVRFQNTGTDTAFRVVIRDTLDPSLDIPTIEMGAGSHPFTWKLEDNGVLVITFDNIGLPDDKENLLGSQGYVKYTLHLKKSLPEGTTIQNRASIYFDFNTGVLTNQVINVTPSMSGVNVKEMVDAVRSYPRPAQGELYVDGPVVAGTEMKLRGIDGRVVLSTVARGTGHERIGVGSVPAGVYLLEMQTVQGLNVQRVVIAR